MKEFPTLFKLTSTNAIQYWKISVEEFICNYGKIITEYGQVGTDKPQITSDIISVGKNNGKTNETTPYEQAIKEAEATWNKKLKSGYVKSEEEATSGKVDNIIEGGVLPMLAHKYKDHSNKIKFPCFGNRKYDGTRCIAIVKNGKCSLWSRTRKRITSMIHIEKELESLKLDNKIFDGELYNHKYKDNFEYLVSKIRPENPVEDYTEVQYHIYDTIDNNTQHERYSELDKIIPSDLTYVKLAEREWCLIMKKNYQIILQSH